MSKGQPRGQVVEKLIFTKLRTCVIPHFLMVLTGTSIIYGMCNTSF